MFDGISLLDIKASSQLHCNPFSYGDVLSRRLLIKFILIRQLLKELSDQVFGLFSV